MALCLYIVLTLAVASTAENPIAVFPKNEVALLGQDSNPFHVNLTTTTETIVMTSERNGVYDKRFAVCIRGRLTGVDFPSEYKVSCYPSAVDVTVLNANSEDAVDRSYWFGTVDAKFLAVAQLIVLGSDPVCGTDWDVSSVVEGTEVTYFCEVEFFGKWGPSMKWRDHNGQDVPMIDQSAGSKVKVVHRRIVTTSDQNMAFSCEVFFTGPPDGTLPDDYFDDGYTVIYSRNAPSYKYTFTSKPLNVVYDFRISDGENPGQGRVELYHEGEWGTLCAYSFGYVEANVACKSRGYKYGEVVKPGSVSEGGSKIWKTGVRCEGGEDSLSLCRISPTIRDVDTCSFGTIVAVRCYSERYAGNEGDIRLVNGKTPNEGLLQVYHDDRWGTVCDDGFEPHEAVKACYKLGYLGGIARKPTDSEMDRDNTIHIFNVMCQDTDKFLEQCYVQWYGYRYCRHYEDVALTCDDNGPRAASNMEY